jgi:hypothetical protein
VLVHPDAPGYLPDIVRDMGFLLVETGAAVRAWAREHGVEDIQQPPLTVTGADPHPSTIGHGIIATVLADTLRSSGIADRLVAKRRKLTPSAGT